MKRVAITLEDIAAYDNLAYASYRAARGKRTRPAVRRFFQSFDQQLDCLSHAIRTGRVPYGRFRRFTIRDPKPRIIHAACFADRILHHAIMHHAGPVLERALTPTTSSYPGYLAGVSSTLGVGGCQQALTACYAAGAGSTTAGTRVQRSATPTTLATATTTSVFVLP
jgi:hypothetical protein